MDRETAMPDFARKLVLHLPSVRYDQHIMTSLRQFVREVDDMALDTAYIQFRQYLDDAHYSVTCPALFRLFAFR